MSYTRERDQFLLTAQKHGISYDTATKLLRYSSTLQRLAEAQCNGDYPYHVDRDQVGEARIVTCSICEARYLKGTGKAIREHDSPKGDRVTVCQDCYAQHKVTYLLAREHANVRPVFNGDPRGAVLRLVPTSTPDADVESGRERGIYVPAR